MKEHEEITIVKKLFLWFVVVMLLVSGFVWFLGFAGKTISTGIVRYEEYLEIYQTCEKLKTDLCNMEQQNESDKMFEQFSKQQRLLSIKTQLNRWVEEYNAKSKMINRSLWKSSELPYQLNVNQFNCN